MDSFKKDESQKKRVMFVFIFVLVKLEFASLAHLLNDYYVVELSGAPLWSSFQDPSSNFTIY